MKKLTTIFLSLVGTALMAQIPNAGFENWTNGTPNSWYDVSGANDGTVIQSAVAHSGSSALELAVSSSIGGSVQTGTSHDSYFANAGSYKSITFYYKLNAVGAGDALGVVFSQKTAANSNNGFGLLTLSTTQASYTQATCNFVFTAGGTDDSASIGFYLYNTSSNPLNGGTTAFVDDVALGTNVTGVNEVETQPTIEKVYPNPASTYSKLYYGLPTGGNVSIELYDISGRKLKALQDNAYLPAGHYMIPCDVTDLANGIYIYRLTVDGQSYTQKLVVAKN